MVKPEFVDAEKMHRDNPATFRLPSSAELDSIRPGWFIKVSTGGERFWAVVTDIWGDDIIAVVDNYIVNFETHGLLCGDYIHVKRRNVYQVST